MLSDDSSAYKLEKTAKKIKFSVTLEKDELDANCDRLTKDEYENLRSLNVTSSSKSDAGGRRYILYAFTEQDFVESGEFF